MQEAGSEWSLKISRRQQALDAMFLLIIPIALAPLAGAFSMSVWIVLTSVMVLALFLGHLYQIHRLGTQGVSRIGLASSGWWLEKDGVKRNVSWHSLTVRRPGFLLIKESWYPWSGIILRPENLRSESEFRRLSASIAEFQNNSSSLSP